MNVPGLIEFGTGFGPSVMHATLYNDRKPDEPIARLTFGGGYGRRATHTINWQAIGHYFADKYTAAAQARGYRAAAAQLRKQGVPLEVAYRIFFGKELPR